MDEKPKKRPLYALRYGGGAVLLLFASAALVYDKEDGWKISLLLICYVIPCTVLLFAIILGIEILRRWGNEEDDG